MGNHFQRVKETSFLTSSLPSYAIRIEKYRLGFPRVCSTPVQVYVTVTAFCHMSIIVVV